MKLYTFKDDSIIEKLEKRFLIMRCKINKLQTLIKHEKSLRLELEIASKNMLKKNEDANNTKEDLENQVKIQKSEICKLKKREQELEKALMYFLSIIKENKIKIENKEVEKIVILKLSA
ncbi:MAG: hypothetical protein ACK4GN_03845 [Runella sp.]